MVLRPVFETSLTPNELGAYVGRLVDSYIPDGIRSEIDLGTQVATALERVEHCFANIHRKYYTLGGHVRFDHLNGDHMATFLYFLANSMWRSTGEEILPTKLFMLNKAMNGLDLFYAVDMPQIFLLVHPVGSVIGNAVYGDYLVVYQNCTIGADAGIYPTFGEGAVLYSRTSVLGNSTIGDDVVFASNTFVVNSDIPPHSLVVGQFPHHRVLPNNQSVRERLFDA